MTQAFQQGHVNIAPQPVFVFGLAHALMYHSSGRQQLCNQRVKYLLKQHSLISCVFRNTYEGGCSAAQGKIIIINAPFGSGSLWKVASLLLPPSTRAKVCICSSGCADGTPFRKFP